MTLRRLMMDIRPLRESPEFRRLWIGSGLSAIGGQMTAFAVVLQIYLLTRSSTAVGAAGLVTAAPVIAFGLLGGSVADAVDRRRLALLTGALLAGVSALFAVQAFAGNARVWPLYCLIAAQSLLGAVNGPVRRTFLPRLLPPELVPAGAALNMFSMHLSLTAGPALAGVLAGVWGLKACYLVDALSFAGALYGTARLPAMPPEGGAARTAPGVRAVADALRFIRGDRVIGGAFLADMSATILGMPFALLPAINADRFGGSARTLGLLTAAPAIGGILGSALSGPVGRVSRQGRGMLLAGAVWGAGLAGFGLARSLWLAVALLAVAGAADVVSVVFRTTVVQLATPDRYRGRVAAAEYVVGSGCPQLGNFRAGAVGSLTSPAAAMVAGGLSVIAGAALIRLAFPALARTPSVPGPDPARTPADDADGPAVGHRPAPDGAPRRARLRRRPAGEGTAGGTPPRSRRGTGRRRR